ncbi:TAF6-like RNA polymerase II p300/CBP-associated factor-associated factor 65 kDa subunit 6L [Liolophura sinensis]|uniref:TAF6-like RNA polymerase II p300/CBP-associated factor-associated factor 65 kDa subunit 6L n=1 Tax=Liolophura sinensis TaxID=3198878 RepID=UPI00315884F8
MADEKKFSDEKHYAILTRESIRVYGECAGHAEIPDDVAGMLGQDVSYRLRAIAQVGAQFMRHSRRRRMTTEDINKALRNMDVQPVFGHGSLDPQSFQQTREGEIHFVEDLEVNFSNMATNSYVPKNMGNTSIKSHWLAVEGVQKPSASQQQVQQTQNPSQPGKPNVKPGPKAVSPELLLYYDNITKAILGCDEEHTKVALDDLRTNNKLVPLLPYFVNFVSNGVKTISYDITQLTKLLHTVKALIRNPHLYLEPQPYLTLLVQAVLYCMLEPLAASINPLNDHWFIRDYAARLLAQIIQRWKTPVNQLFQSSLQALKDALHDLAKPSCSHYGAVMGLLSLGPQVVEDTIIPHLPNYWPHLETIMEDSSVANALAKADAHKVYGAILLAVEFLIKQKLKDFQCECSKISSCPNAVIDVAEEKDKVSVKEETRLPQAKQMPCRGQKMCDFYKDMYGYFGDSLAMRLPKLNLQHVFKPTKKEALVSLRDKEIDGKTGEDLLENFMQQVRIQQIKEAEERKKREERERLLAIERHKQLIRAMEEERRRKDEKLRRIKEAERKRHLEELRRNELQHQEEITRQYGQQPTLMRQAAHYPSFEYDGPSDAEEEQDVDVEETSSRSPESEKSEDKSEEEQPYFPSDPSHMNLTVKSTVSDPTKGIKLTISKRPKMATHVREERAERLDRSDKHKDKEYRQSKKRKQSQRSPRESSRSPWDPDRNDGGEVKRKADLIYQFDVGDHVGKPKSTVAKRLSQRGAEEPDNYELVDGDHMHCPGEKLTIKLAKSKPKGASASQRSPNYS